MTIGNGNVRVSLSGFEGQEVIRVEEVATALQILPEGHLRGLRAINYDPSRRLQRLACSYSGCQIPDHATEGQYHDSLDTILIFQFDTKERFYSILYHEIGHHVFRDLIRPDIRNEWVQEIHPQIPGVTAYSETNASENFAEAYSWYVLHRRNPRLDARARAFMKDRVFQNADVPVHKLDREGLASGKTINLRLLQLQVAVFEHRSPSSSLRSLPTRSACPKCQGDLTHVVLCGDISIDRCEGCSGTWLDYGELDCLSRVSGSAGRVEGIERNRPPTMVDDHVLHFHNPSVGNACPRCSLPLREVYFKPDPTIWVDMCEGCKGAFYDWGELGRALAVLQEEGHG